LPVAPGQLRWVAVEVAPPDSRFEALPQRTEPRISNPLGLSGAPRRDLSGHPGELAERDGAEGALGMTEPLARAS
jgi:hypothetical protein